MSAPTLDDLRARVDAAKKANIMQKAALAELALADLLQYLTVQDSRITELEKGQTNGK